MELRAPNVRVFGMRMFMPAIADQTLQCRGHVWTAHPELRWLLNEAPVGGALSNHALAHELDY
eukprot:2750152-Lingulodinium_polyedra.AAC.1